MGLRNARPPATSVQQILTRCHGGMLHTRESGTIGRSPVCLKLLLNDLSSAKHWTDQQLGEIRHACKLIVKGLSELAVPQWE